jgi:hypothetical protein
MTTADAIVVHQALTNNDFAQDDEGNFYFSCGVNAQLAFVLNGIPFNIRPQDYILQPVTSFPNGSATPSNWCLGNIQGQESPNNPPTLGAPFIRNVSNFTIRVIIGLHSFGLRRQPNGVCGSNSLKKIKRQRCRGTVLSFDSNTHETSHPHLFRPEAQEHRYIGNCDLGKPWYELDTSAAQIELKYSTLFQGFC